jgi:hypothetical protein
LASSLISTVSIFGFSISIIKYTLLQNVETPAGSLPYRNSPMYTFPFVHNNWINDFCIPRKYLYHIPL